jgi:hypothetical protein
MKGDGKPISLFPLPKPEKSLFSFKMISRSQGRGTAGIPRYAEEPSDADDEESA